MSCVTRWQSGHWSLLQLAANASGSTCWPWLLTSATSTSTLPTGSWRPHPNYCSTSPSSRRTSRREGDNDLARPAHGSIPPRASCPPPWCQPTHLRFVCLQLPVPVRVRLEEAQGDAFGSDAGAVVRTTGLHTPRPSVVHTRQSGGNAKRALGCYPFVLPVSGAPLASRRWASASRSGASVQERRYPS